MFVGPWARVVTGTPGKAAPHSEASFRCPVWSHCRTRLPAQGKNGPRPPRQPGPTPCAPSCPGWASTTRWARPRPGGACRRRCAVCPRFAHPCRADAGGGLAAVGPSARRAPAGRRRSRHLSAADGPHDRRSSPGRRCQRGPDEGGGHRPVGRPPRGEDAGGLGPRRDPGAPGLAGHRRCDGLARRPRYRSRPDPHGRTPVRGRRGPGRWRRHRGRRQDPHPRTRPGPGGDRSGRRTRPGGDCRCRAHSRHGGDCRSRARARSWGRGRRREGRAGRTHGRGRRSVGRAREYGRQALLGPADRGPGRAPGPGPRRSREGLGAARREPARARHDRRRRQGRAARDGGERKGKQLWGTSARTGKGSRGSRPRR